MAVGTLNVAVTASTRKAQQELQQFRMHVRRVADEVKRSSDAFSGNTIAEYTKKFGGGKIPTPPKPPTGDLNSFRSSIVDLTSKIDRYSGSLTKQTGLLKGLRKAYKDLHDVAHIFIAIKVAQESVAFGQGIREYVSYISDWDDAVQQLGAAFGFTKSKQDELMEQTERQNAIMEAQNAAIVARSTAEREMLKEFEKRVQAESDAVLAAKGFNVDTQLRSDVEQFGQTRANQLYELRQQAADAEEHAAAEKLRREEEIEARRERDRKAEQAAERRRERIRKEEEALEELRKKNRQFFMTANERRRDDLSGEIKDPARRRAAAAQLAELEANERAEAARKVAQNRLKLLRDSAGNSLAATGADSREGFAQRVRFGNQNRINKIAEDQLKEQRLTRVAVQQLANRAPMQLEAANIGGG